MSINPATKMLPDPGRREREAVIALKPVLLWRHGEHEISCGTSWLVFKKGDQVLLRLRGTKSIRQLATFLANGIMTGGGTDEPVSVFPLFSSFQGQAGMVDIRLSSYSNSSLLLVINGAQQLFLVNHLVDLLLWLVQITGIKASHTLKDDASRVTLGSIAASRILYISKPAGGSHMLGLGYQAARELRDELLRAVAVSNGHETVVELGDNRSMRVWPGDPNGWAYLSYFEGAQQVELIGFSKSALVRLAAQLHLSLPEGAPEE